MIELKDKRILLISAKFFSYEVEITKKLSELGANVDYFDQRPSNTFLTKVLIRINNRLLAQRIEAYYLSMFRKIEGISYDYVLFISPETITKDLLIKLKSSQKGAKFLLYMWDSFRNKSKSIKELIPFFDHRFSFDKDDCKNSEFQLQYRPLFFLNEYSLLDSSHHRVFDLLFIGTIHSDRFKILTKIKKESGELSSFFYMYFPSKLLFYAKYLLDKSFWTSKMSHFQFLSLKKDEVLDYMAQSKIVIDIQHPNQIGLTMRTIEVLGARRKLITTNEDILNYDFYHPNNILLIDRENPKLSAGFLQSPLYPLSPALYERYSIDGWIRDLFSIN